MSAFAFGADNSDDITARISSGLSSWIPTVKTACLWVFGTLAVIDITWTFSKIALRGFELGEFLSELVKKIIYIGIFLFLFNIDIWLQTIFDSFIQLSASVNGGAISVTPSSVITNAFNIAKIIFNSMSVLEPGQSVFKALVGLIILVAFIFMAVDLLIAYVKFYLLSVISFFAFALGGLSHFKSIGLNPILASIKIGIEVFIIQALMALCIKSIQNAFVELSAGEKTDTMLQILIMSLIFAMITRVVPTIIEATFSGGLGESAGAAAGFRAVGAMAAGAVGVAAAGAIGATRAVSAARALHIAEGGGGGMDMLKGIAKNIATHGKESLSQGLGMRSTSNDIANRMRFKTETIKSAQSNFNMGGGISSGATASEPYYSGLKEQE